MLLQPGPACMREGGAGETEKGSQGTRGRVNRTRREAVDVVQGATNAELPALLNRPRPPWAKVRWISIQGISWELILQLAHR